MTASAQTEQSLIPPSRGDSGKERYLALDAYRGLIMVSLVSGGFGLGSLSPHSTLGRFAPWFNHVPWEGAVFWDLIQPAFMFMVGVAMPFALAKRQVQGANFWQLLGRVVTRSLKLLLLSQLLEWMASGHLRFELDNVLCQIAFTYCFSFLIIQMTFHRQVLTAGLILAGYAGLFRLFPGPDGPYSRTCNVGAVIDHALLGYNYDGYYISINFISSTVTTLFGAWTGMLLRSREPRSQKLVLLLAVAMALLAGGKALAIVDPMIKRLWTASFTLYSVGWVLLIMVALLALIDHRGFTTWAFPFKVVGMNSIVAYSIGEGLGGLMARLLAVSTGEGLTYNDPFASIAGSWFFLLVIWTVCYLLYRRRVFLKL